MVAIVEMLDHALDFLYECIEGPCLQNQQILIDSNIVEALHIIFSTCNNKDKFCKSTTQKQLLLKLTDDAVNICIGLIDGDKPSADYPFTSSVVNQIDFKAVIDLMIEGFKDWDGKADEYSKITLSGFDAYRLLATLKYNSEYAARLIEEAWKNANNTLKFVEANRDEDTDTVVKTRKFYENRTLSIEIANEYGELEIIRFPKVPICDSLLKERKKHFIANVDRSSTHSKVNAFFQQFDSFLQRLEGTRALKKHMCLQSVHQYRTWIYTINTMMMFALNIVLLITAKPYDDEYKIEPKRLGMWMDIDNVQVFNILSYILIAMLAFTVFARLVPQYYI